MGRVTLDELFYHFFGVGGVKIELVLGEADVGAGGGGIDTLRVLDLGVEFVYVEEDGGLHGVDEVGGGVQGGGELRGDVLGGEEGLV